MPTNPYLPPGTRKAIYNGHVNADVIEKHVRRLGCGIRLVAVVIAAILGVNLLKYGLVPAVVAWVVLAALVGIIWRRR